MSPGSMTGLPGPQSGGSVPGLQFITVNPGQTVPPRQVRKRHQESQSTQYLVNNLQFVQPRQMLVCRTQRRILSVIAASRADGVRLTDRFLARNCRGRRAMVVTPLLS